MFKARLMLVVAMLLVWLGAGEQVMALELLEAGYVAQTHVSMPSPGLGRDQALEFDSGGNMYIGYRGSSRDVKDGCIYRITPEGTGAIFSTGFYSAIDISCGSGTDFRDYLYVCDEGVFESSSHYGDVKKVDLSSGSSSILCYPWNQPICLGIDRVGNYGGSLYVGTSGLDHIDEVTVGGSISNFSGYPYDIGGGSPIGIAFDPGTRYGGQMYASTYSSNSATWAGVFSLDGNGNPTRFTTDIAAGMDIEFDVMGQYFGGDLFVRGNEQLGGYFHIYRISADGDASLFAREAVDSTIGNFTFGPDGAMYVLKDAGGTLSVTRVIPEPVTVFLLGAGGLYMFRRRRDGFS
ncbi:MAG: PEP-CTERM sorting domain-containing protein [Sedimentisphaerales bacterium]|nr:PEP-CTERM sorting domain-containing protein [Sedimentisphaerales bacterium]